MKRSNSCTLIAVACFLATLGACSGQKTEPETQAQSQTQAPKETPPKEANALPGMPPVADPSDIYAADHAGN